jgi:hypothetical protein
MNWISKKFLNCQWIVLKIFLDANSLQHYFSENFFVWGDGRCRHNVAIQTQNVLCFARDLVLICIS